MSMTGCPGLERQGAGPMATVLSLYQVTPLYEGTGTGPSVCWPVPPSWLPWCVTLTRWERGGESGAPKLLLGTPGLVMGVGSSKGSSCFQKSGRSHNSGLSDPPWQGPQDQAQKGCALETSE